MKFTKKELARIEDEVGYFKEKYDNVIILGNLTEKDRRKLIDEVYIIKEKNDVILSGGMMIWLFFNYVINSKKKKLSINQFIENEKILHRIKLIGIDINNLDKEKIRNAIGEERMRKIAFIGRIIPKKRIIKEKSKKMKIMKRKARRRNER